MRSLAFVVCLTSSTPATGSATPRVTVVSCCHTAEVDSQSRPPTPGRRPETLTRRADRVPADRNRVVDLVRACALVVVVLGHWAMQGLYVVEGAGGPVLQRQGLLQIAPWTHPFTWFLQVMPLFFLVGGYVNLRSWRTARGAGRTYGTWLAGRTGRLTRPVVPLLVFWALVTPAAETLGLGEDWLGIAGRASLVPTWFLAVYVVVVALTPVTSWAWERAGVWTVVGGLAAAGLVDAVSLRLEGDAALAVGALNALLVWATLHQVGYGWLDGSLQGPLRGAVLLAVGVLGAVVLVRWGPYALSMVGVSGFGVDNALPPRVTLLLVGLGQAGAVLLAERLLARVVARRRVWLVVALVGSRAMTVYLWHLTALGILAAVSLWLGGLGLDPLPGTSEWWWDRLPWFALLAVTTAAVVQLVGRFEEVRSHPAGAAPVPARWPVLEVLVVCVVLGCAVVLGLVADDRSARWWLPLAGALALVAADRGSRPRG